MANLRLIKGRIKSVKNITQITKAMELVAASKMKKAQLQAVAGKLYAQKIYEMVYRLAKRVTVATHPLISKPINPDAKKIVILI
jgi:F-type H+-transporting ATPase subunit gamma